MAFRRSSSSKRRFARPRSRSRSRLREPSQQGRWEKGNFFLQQILSPDDPDQELNTYQHLASIKFSVGGDDAQAGSNITRTLANFTRHIEIGGMVFDWGIHPMNTIYGAAEGDIPAFWLKQEIMTDRLDEVGQPDSLGQSRFLNTTPIVLANNNGQNNQELLQPTRVHWRRTELIDANYVEQLPSDVDVVPTGAQQRLVRDQRRTENLRLNIKLPDELALWFAVSFVTSAFWPATIPFDFEWWAEGSIWYRVRL